jgi:hypothetical protein
MIPKVLRQTQLETMWYGAVVKMTLISLWGLVFHVYFWFSIVFIGHTIWDKARNILLSNVTKIKRVDLWFIKDYTVKKCVLLNKEHAALIHNKI